MNIRIGIYDDFKKKLSPEKEKNKKQIILKINEQIKMVI